MIATTTGRSLVSLRSIGCFALASLLFGAAAPAQGRTIIVDSQGRPGTEYTDLPPAVAAAQPGDVLRVRDGSYTGFTTSKGIAIMGEPGARITRAPIFFGTKLKVENLPAGQTFAMTEIDLSPPVFGSGQQIQIWSNLGTVVLENVGSVVRAGLNVNALSVSQSELVLIKDSSFEGGQGIVIYASNVVVTNCWCKGGDGFSLHGVWPGHPGIEVQSSKLVVSGTTLLGGDAFSPSFSTMPGPALRMTDSVVTLTGDGSTGAQAGGNQSAPMPAIDGSGGTLILNPVVPLVSNGGAPLVAAAITVDRRPVPSLRAAGAPLGGTVQIDLFSAPNDLFVLVLGWFGPPLPLPGVGDIWLDPLRPILPVAAGALGPAGTHSLSASVPANPAALGLTLVWQAAAGTVQNGLLASNPDAYSHN